MYIEPAVRRLRIPVQGFQDLLLIVYSLLPKTFILFIKSSFVVGTHHSSDFTLLLNFTFISSLQLTLVYCHCFLAFSFELPDI